LERSQQRLESEGGLASGEVRTRLGLHVKDSELERLSHQLANHTTLFGNLNIGSGPGAITLEDVTLSAAGTTTFEVAGTDTSQFDRLTLVGSVALDGTAQITFCSSARPASVTWVLRRLSSFRLVSPAHS